MRHVKKTKSESHKVTKWAIRSVTGAYACRKPEAKLPFRREDLEFYNYDDDRLGFAWFLLDSKEQAEWYISHLIVSPLAELHPVRIDLTVKITPAGKERRA